MKGDSEDSGQLILIGGLIVAIAIVSIAAVIGGGIFSQQAGDTGNQLSVFTSQADSELEVIGKVSDENIEHVNEQSIEGNGSYPEEICGELVNMTNLQEAVSGQLGSGETLLDFEVQESCGRNVSWVVGQVNYNELPGANFSNKNETTLTCSAIHALTGYSEPTNRTNLTNYLENKYSGELPDEFNDSEIAEGFENVPTLDTSFIDENEDITLTGYINDCIKISVQPGRAPADIVFAIDTTGSMNYDNKMYYTRKGAKEAINGLNESDKVGLVEYKVDRPDVGNFQCTSWWLGICFNYEYQNGGARELSELKQLDSSHVNDLENEIDGLDPEGGTDITTGLNEAKNTLDAGKRGDGTTNHIVLMTDGKQSPGLLSDEFNSGEKYPGDYIDYNENEFNDTFIHTIALGDSSDINETLLEKLANEDGSYSSIRPNGTSVISSDPSKAENIFEDIIGNIEDRTKINKTANATIPNPDKELEVTLDSGSGVIEEVHDLRLNATEFTGNGTYNVRIYDGTGENIVWEAIINNTYTGNNSTNPHIGYKIIFKSETKPELNEELVVSGDDNLSKPSEYFWMDLLGESEGKPLMELGSTPSTGLSNHSSYSEYIEASRSEIQRAANPSLGEEGVTIEFGELNNLDGVVNGTFSFEFKPLGGNLSNIGNITETTFGDSCEDTGKGIPKCGFNNTDGERVSTSIIKSAIIIAEIETPQGRLTKEIKIPQEGTFEYDILE